MFIYSTVHNKHLQNITCNVTINSCWINSLEHLVVDVQEKDLIPPEPVQVLSASVKTIFDHHVTDSPAAI